MSKSDLSTIFGSASNPPSGSVLYDLYRYFANFPTRNLIFALPFDMNIAGKRVAKWREVYADERYKTSPAMWRIGDEKSEAISEQANQNSEPQWRRLLSLPLIRHRSQYIGDTVMYCIPTDATARTTAVSRTRRISIKMI
ncbi:MAG: hypothetical protein LBN39_01915 [Planctomycetaceae bacterium]|jgi:hypothetical protein|nr:hypothetical protein [Planctomycetaceae bacterium]